MSTVVIIGRKNVGKSTIFNRLTGMRLSVVYKEPGVTRDRVYGEMAWRGKILNLVDTGGFFPNEDDVLTREINRQIQYGMEEADLIYFVVDGKDGLNPVDEEICQYVRKTNKPIFLLVNKIDIRKSAINLLEFSKFGFDNIFYVSAEAGIGLGDVLDETMKILPETQGIKEDKTIKVLILGRPNSGKSTLLNTVIKQERAIVHEEPGTTRDLVNAKFTFKNKSMEIIDTAGLRRTSRIKESIEFYSVVRAIKTIELANVVILIFDTTQGVVEQDRRIASMILSKAKGFVIAPNKIDLIDKKDIKRIVPSTYKTFTSLEFVPIVPISAKTDIGVETLLNRILDVYNENNKVINKNLLNNISGYLKPPDGGRLLSLRQIGARPPIFRATLSISVKKNYISYIRNTIRQYFGFSGVPILIKTKIVRKTYTTSL